MIFARTMRVVLIGTGRAAFQLGHALRRVGVIITGVMGRNATRAVALAADLDSTPFPLDADVPPSDLRLLAVSDDALVEVVAALPISEVVTAHLSGAKPLSLLGEHPHRGVLWPVQSLSPGAPVDLWNVPVVLEGEDEQAQQVLEQVARLLSTQVLQLPHDQRLLLHAAATIAGNLPVFLLYEAQKLLQANGLAPDLIIPLWQAVTTKAASGAEAALTGPARRGDVGTMQQHVERLAGDADLRRAYAVLSNMILKTWHPEKRGPEDV